MIKFIIGLIAVVFVALVAYMFTQPKKAVDHKVAKKIETRVTTSHEVEDSKIPQPKAKEHLSAKAEKKDAMDKIVTAHKSIEESNSIESEDEIGKGLTLEDIENADVSDEEKERMRDDLAYYQDLHTEPSERLSDKEILKIIEEDLKNGFIKK